MDWHREFSCCPCAQDVKKFVEEIKAAGGHAELYLYQGEGHAFMNAKPDSLERMQSAPLHCPYPAPVLHVQIPVASLMQGPTCPMSRSVPHFAAAKFMRMRCRAHLYKCYHAAAGIPEGRNEDRQLAWRRVFEFFKNNLG